MAHRARENMDLFRAFAVRRSRRVGAKAQRRKQSFFICGSIRLWILLLSQKYSNLFKHSLQVGNSLVHQEQQIDELRQKIAVGTEEMAKGQVTDGEVVFARFKEIIRKIAEESEKWVVIHFQMKQLNI